MVYTWFIPGLSLVYPWFIPGLPLVTPSLPLQNPCLPLIYSWFTPGLPLVYPWFTPGLSLVYLCMIFFLFRAWSTMFDKREVPDLFVTRVN